MSSLRTSLKQQRCRVKRSESALHFFLYLHVNVFTHDEQKTHLLPAEAEINAARARQIRDVQCCKPKPCTFGEYFPRAGTFWGLKQCYRNII